MPANEPPYCRHGRPECTCLDDAIANAQGTAQQSGAISVFVNSGSLDPSDVAKSVIAQLSTVGAMTGTGTTTNGNSSASSTHLWTYPPPEDPPAAPEPTACQQTGHHITEESLAASGDEIWGMCETCSELVQVPRVAGSLNYERVGQYIGRAMTLEGAEDEGNGAELYVELEIFERKCREEMAKYDRTLKMIDMARDIAKRNLLQQD